MEIVWSSGRIYTEIVYSLLVELLYYMLWNPSIPQYFLVKCRYKRTWESCNISQLSDECDYIIWLPWKRIFLRTQSQNCFIIMYSAFDSVKLAQELTTLT